MVVKRQSTEMSIGEMERREVRDKLCNSKGRDARGAGTSMIDISKESTLQRRGGVDAVSLPVTNHIYTIFETGGPS